MRASVGVVILLIVASAACGPTVDLSKGLQVLDVETGWYDAGISEGKNKLVPSISFKLKNVSDRKLTALQVNAIFHRVTENKEFGSGFLAVAGSAGLGAGQTTSALTIRASHGYTGTDPRQQMLENKEFVDARVELFAKYNATQWKRIGEYPIARRLIPR